MQVKLSEISILLSRQESRVECAALLNNFAMSELPTCNDSLLKFMSSQTADKSSPV